ncbi:MAG: hypothetical protein IPN46_09530 [Saprospiraceae bacterium]|nr:hypothetical protein [Saprospiraceae bacterium]
MHKCLIFLLFVMIFCGVSKAQSAEPTDPKATEDWSRRPTIVQGLKSPSDIPSDAIILFKSRSGKLDQKDGTPTD